MIKNILILSFVFLLASCGGSSSTGAQVEESIPGTMIPASFIGVYTGTLNVTAEAIGITESDSFPITITVTDDGMIRFDGDEPDETFTVGLMDNGDFSGNLPIDVDPCEGTIGVVGTVDGTNITGTVSGEGVCEEGILELDVDLEGDFSASR